MTLEDLRTFVAAYDAGSMSEAARRLGCTQGAVAQHVRRLEQELGAELFARQRRGVAPTFAGRRLYEVASTALDSLDQVVREIEHSLRQRSDRLRLTTSTGIIARYLREPLLLLRQRRPGVEVEIEAENTAEARLVALREGRADLAMIPLTDRLRSLEVMPYGEAELMLLVHPEHPFAARKKVRMDDLSAIRYIAQSPTSGTCRHLERALRARGVSLQPAHIVEDAANANLMVEMGHGETFVPANLKGELERSHRVTAVEVDSLPPIPMGWAARNFSLLPAAASELIEVCAQLAQRPEARAGTP